MYLVSYRDDDIDTLGGRSDNLCERGRSGNFPFRCPLMEMEDFLEIELK